MVTVYDATSRSPPEQGIRYTTCSQHDCWVATRIIACRRVRVPYLEFPDGGWRSLTPAWQMYGTESMLIRSDPWRDVVCRSRRVNGLGGSWNPFGKEFDFRLSSHPCSHSRGYFDHHIPGRLYRETWSAIVIDIKNAIFVRRCKLMATCVRTTTLNGCACSGDAVRPTGPIQRKGQTTIARKYHHCVAPGKMVSIC